MDENVQLVMKLTQSRIFITSHKDEKNNFIQCHMFNDKWWSGAILFQIIQFPANKNYIYHNITYENNDERV